jgi:predicted SprT family Zn-dependent metalloprotease
MDARAAETLAIQLMAHHRLIGWTFRFNRRKRALGLCIYEPQRIELSLPYVLRNAEPSIRDTILHEIAHALAGRDAHHGPRWKKVCRQIGATPQRCDTIADMPDGRWIGACPGCRKQFTRHRRPKRGRKYFCRTCGPERGQLKWRIPQITTVPAAPPPKMIRPGRITEPTITPIRPTIKASPPESAPPDPIRTLWDLV